jgi:hypothetical protein
MEIVVEELFIQQLQKCPIVFQEKFRKVYQQLKIVDKPSEIKNIIASSTVSYYKLYIDQSRIGLLVKDNKLYILCFLYNQYF